MIVEIPVLLSQHFKMMIIMQGEKKLLEMQRTDQAVTAYLSVCSVHEVAANATTNIMQ